MINRAEVASAMLTISKQRPQWDYDGTAVDEWLAEFSSSCTAEDLQETARRFVRTDMVWPTTGAMRKILGEVLRERLDSESLRRYAPQECDDAMRTDTKAWARKWLEDRGHTRR